MSLRSSSGPPDFPNGIIIDKNHSGPHVWNEEEWRKDYERRKEEDKRKAQERREKRLQRAARKQQQ